MTYMNVAARVHMCAGLNGDCIVDKRHYDDTVIPLELRYNFPSCQVISTEYSTFQVRPYAYVPLVSIVCA